MRSQVRQTSNTSNTSNTSTLGASLPLPLSLFRILLHGSTPHLLEVTHHRLQATLLLAQLRLQLLHNLYLHLGLGCAPVVQHVAPGEMAEKNIEIFTLSITTSPFTKSLAVQRMLTG